MDLYEWMRAVTRQSRFSEPAEHDALALVDRLETTAAFGTLAGRTEITEHLPVYPFMSSVCSICQKEHDV
jgi:hypothetical protein